MVCILQWISALNTIQCTAHMLQKYIFKWYNIAYRWQKAVLDRHESEQVILLYIGINKWTPIEENNKMNTKPIKVALPSFLNIDHTTYGYVK